MARTFRPYVLEQDLLLPPSLREWWQDYEAGIQEGIEDAADHPEKPVPSHNGQERRGDPSPGRGPA
jgi:hypothetical protein